MKSCPVCAAPASQSAVVCTKCGVAFAPGTPARTHSAGPSHPIRLPDDISVDAVKARFASLSQGQKLGVAAAVAVIGLVSLIVLVQILKHLGGLIGAIFLLIVLAALFMAWAAPIFIAFKRDHPSKLSIIVVNVVFGWTFIGWIIALIWSLSNNDSKAGATVIVNQGNVSEPTTVRQQPGMYPPPPPPLAPEYLVGDVVNGHRFNGMSWAPLTTEV